MDGKVRLYLILSIDGISNVLYTLTYIVLLIWTPLIVNSATHWVLEDGLIKSQVDTWYNIYDPSDLMLFIQQTETADKLKALEKQEDLKFHTSFLTADAILKNQENIAFHSDPDCQIARKKLSQFDLYLSSFLRLDVKGIIIEQYLNHKRPLPTKINQPFCTSEFLFSMKSYDHLKGVSERKFLPNKSEEGLVNPIPQVKNLTEFGQKVYWALQKNETSWILLNFAAIYWRVAGNSYEAIECLRRALDVSPRLHKDLALVSLANILHQSKYSLDAAILMHSALEITKDYDIIYFTLGNIYGALGQYDLADICYKYVYELQPDFEAARLRMHASRCEHKLNLILNQDEHVFNEKNEDEELSIRKQIIEEQKKEMGYSLKKYNIYNALELPENEKV